VEEGKERKEQEEEKEDDIVTILWSVTIDGVWIGNWIY
jgi:hypothetical protein